MMLDSPIEKGQQWLKSLLRRMGATSDVSGKLEFPPVQYGDDSESDNYWLTIDASRLTPGQIELLIGDNGCVLDAIQYLVNSSLNSTQVQPWSVSYTVELNGYRSQRQAEIQALAQAAVDKVRSSGREVEIKSLTSAERRLVHSLLKDFPDLETFSRGREPHRHLVVTTATVKSPPFNE